MFLPAGALVDNYIDIGCLFGSQRQWKINVPSQTNLV
jgi:hypothetical protein